VAANAKKTRGSTRSAKRKKTDDASHDSEEDLESDEGDDSDGGNILASSTSPTARPTARRGSTAGGSNAPKKFETEEEKRRNFLERNRQAALKCRQRKKAWLAELQAKVEYLTVENEQLQSTILSMREEISRLTAVVVAQGGVVVPGVGASMGNNIPGGGHGQGGHGKGGANGVRGRDEGAPVSVSVSLPGSSIVTHAPTGSGGHYGY
jgi:ATF/CREB family transcription factor